QVLQRIFPRNSMTLDHLLKRSEGRVAHRFASVGALGEVDKLGQPRLAGGAVAVELIMAKGLPVDYIVTMPAPGVEHHRTLAGALVEQLGRRGEAFGANIDRLRGVVDDLLAHPEKSSSINLAVALAEPTT